MAGVPALCENCGALFESPLVALGTGAVVSFNSCGSSCPRCGAMARILDGTYRGMEDAIEVVRASTFTREQVAKLQRLRAMLAEQKKDDATPIPQEVIDAVSAIEPALGAAVKLLQTKKGGWAAVMLLLYLILRQCNSEGHTPINIDLSSHTTIVAPRINLTELNDSRDLKEQNGRNDAQAASDSTEAKKD